MTLEVVCTELAFEPPDYESMVHILNHRGTATRAGLAEEDENL